MKFLQKPYLLFTLLLTCTLALDQWTKMLVSNSAHLPIILIKNFFGIENFARISLHHNTGIAFSIPIPTMVIYILIALLVIFGGRYLLREINMRNMLSQTSLALILAGTIGNLADRIRFGYVIDFISVWKFAVFNVADAAIFAGIGLLIIFYSKLKRKELK